MGEISSPIVDLFKEGQRKSKAFKQGWATYRMNTGLQKDDPAQNTEKDLVGYLEFISTAATSIMSGGMAGGGGAAAAWGGAPPAKKANTGGNSLVDKIKAYQKQGETEKQNWWTFAAQYGTDKDPARFEADVLQQFASTYGVW